MKNRTPQENRILALTLSKVTGWGLGDVESLTFEEAEEYLEDAIDVANEFARAQER